MDENQVCLIFFGPAAKTRPRLSRRLCVRGRFRATVEATFPMVPGELEQLAPSGSTTRFHARRTTLTTRRTSNGWSAKCARDDQCGESRKSWKLEDRYIAEAGVGASRLLGMASFLTRRSRRPMPTRCWLARVSKTKPVTIHLKSATRQTTNADEESSDDESPDEFDLIKCVRFGGWG